MPYLHTRRGRRYHLAGCRYVAGADAIPGRGGLAPCSRCCPGATGGGAGGDGGSGPSMAVGARAGGAAPSPAGAPSPYGGKPYFADAAVDLRAMGVAPLAVYAHGSRVYGTDGPGSDRDHEVIVDDGWDGEEQAEVGEGGRMRQYTLLTRSRWLREAEECTVLFCECAFLPEGLSVTPLAPDGWAPDPERVRRQFSRTASNSWVKCKKKLTVPGSLDPYVAKKSMWHSLRILMFGIQILEHGRIVDYREANPLYAEVMAMPDDWGAIDARFRPLRNELRSRFRSMDAEMGIVRHGPGAHAG